MNKKKIGFIFSAIRSLLFVKIRPLVVSFVLTHRCNKKCLYCRYGNVYDNSHYNTYEELSMVQICDIIQSLCKLGVRFITFTGGEPLVRDDIYEIVEYAFHKNMFIKINSNGSLWHKNKRLIELVDKIQLSLDGPEEIHDKLRGKNSFQEVISSAKLINALCGRFYFSTVLTEYNYQSVSSLLELAAYLKTKILFQPVNPRNIEYCIMKDYFLSFLYSKNYKTAITYLIKLKSEGNPYIMNSLRGLKYLCTLPDDIKEESRIYCCAGRYSFRIGPQAEIYGCASRYRQDIIYEQRRLTEKLAEVDKYMPKKMCGSCYCAGMVETNLLFSLDTKAILNALTL